jgi:hypothetical protein
MRTTTTVLSLLSLLTLCGAIDFAAHAAKEMGEKQEPGSASAAPAGVPESLPSAAASGKPREPPGAGFQLWRLCILLALCGAGFAWRHFRSRRAWIPIEADPAVLNRLLGHLLGKLLSDGGNGTTDIAVPRPSGGSGRTFAFVDVLSLEASYLLGGGGGQPGAGLARPCLALMLLLPASAAYERRRKATVARIRRAGQPAVSPRLCFLRQTVGGACGTIAVAHAALNAAGVLLSGEVAPAPGGGSPLLAFARTTVRRRRRRRRGAQGQGGDNNAHVTPAPSLAARSERFAADAAIRACHEACTGTPPSRDGTGATAAAAAVPSSSVQQQPPLSAAALARREGHHFVTLVAVDGVLYELDGRCPFPINCGACGGGGSSRSKQDTFLLKAAAHVKGMVESEGDASALNWALVALVETTLER